MCKILKGKKGKKKKKSLFQIINISMLITVWILPLCVWREKKKTANKRARTSDKKGAHSSSSLGNCYTHRVI